MTEQIADIDPDDYAEVRGGRSFPYATVGDYVALSDVSDRAARVYWLLRMHINGKRGNETVWPAQRSLADILKLKKTDTVRAAIKELVDLGAVTVTTVPGKRGRFNVYEVHEAPAEDYGGLTRLSDFYDERKTAGQRGSTPGEGAPPNRRRIGGKTAGQSGSTPGEGAPPERVGGPPPERVDGSTPGEGAELPEVELPEKNQGGYVTGERHQRARTPERDAPPTPPLRPLPGKPETWRCDHHLAHPQPPGEDKPCRDCGAVRVRCEKRTRELAETEVERTRDCLLCGAEGRRLEDGITLCDHSTSPAEFRSRQEAAAEQLRLAAEARAERIAAEAHAKAEATRNGAGYRAAMAAVKLRQPKSGSPAPRRRRLERRRAA